MTPDSGGIENQPGTGFPERAPAKARHRSRAAFRVAAVAILMLVVGIGTYRVYDALRTPADGFAGMIADMRRIDTEIGPALAGAGNGWRFDMPPGLAPLFQTGALQTQRVAPEAGGRAIVVSRQPALSRTREAPVAGAPEPQGVVPGGEGEIELHNDTEADATLVLAVSRAPGRILKAAQLPSKGGAVVRGLHPETYSLAVTFADYPRSPVRLGPFPITQTVTPEGTVADRYEIHLRPAP